MNCDFFSRPYLPIMEWCVPNLRANSLCEMLLASLHSFNFLPKLSMDVIDFIMHRENISKHEAIKRAAALIDNGVVQSIENQK